MMVFILAPVAEVLVFKNDGSKDLIYLVEKFKGPIAVDRGMISIDHVLFPIANHAIQRNEITIYKLKDKDFKELSKTSSDDGNIFKHLKKDSAIELDGHAKICGNVNAMTITAELDRPAQRDPRLQRWENSHRVKIKFDDKAFVQQWLDFDDMLQHNRDIQPTWPGYGIAIPSCDFCGRIKCNNAHYGVSRMLMQLPVRSWEREYVCGWCSDEFAGLLDHVRGNIETPTRTVEQQFKLCQMLLRIAKEGLDDPLAIATAKTYLAVNLKPVAAIPLLEEARAFLNHHDDSEFADAYNQSQMESLYQINMHFLGKNYMASGELDKALGMFKEGLDYDQKSADELNIAKSKAALGELYLRMGKFRDAEAILLESYQARMRIGANPIFALAPLVMLYMKTGDRIKVVRCQEDLHVTAALFPNLKASCQALLESIGNWLR